jgi:hypothetical protein
MATALLVLGCVVLIAEWIHSVVTRNKADDLTEEQQ